MNNVAINIRVGFPGGSVSKESACNVGDLGLIPRLGGSPEGGNDNLPGAGILHIECILHIVYCILSAALSTASSFRIWNSSTGILSLPGASVRNSAHGKGHEEGGSAYAKAGSSLRSPPGNSRASTPKTRVCLLSALCFHL